MRKVFVLLVSIVAAKAVASPEIRECSMNSMLDKVTSTLAQYAKDVATERRIDFLPESVQVKYLGVRDIVDNKQMPARKQNTFSIEFKTNRGSTMAFMTPAQGLCENKPDFCYYPDNGVVVALPNP